MITIAADQLASHSVWRQWFLVMNPALVLEHMIIDSISDGQSQQT